MRRSVTDKIEQFNSLSEEEAKAELLKCCGSKRWAQLITEDRPFKSLDELLQASDRAWANLAPADWLEAFSSHPRIGEKRAQQRVSEQSQKWSEQEQSAAATASQTVLDELAKANVEYEQKFHYIFIICASGRSPEEILESLRSRMKNDPATELLVAAEEQRHIMHLRLKKLLEP